MGGTTKTVRRRSETETKPTLDQSRAIFGEIFNYHVPAAVLQKAKQGRVVLVFVLVLGDVVPDLHDASIPATQEFDVIATRVLKEEPMLAHRSLAYAESYTRARARQRTQRRDTGLRLSVGEGCVDACIHACGALRRGEAYFELVRTETTVALFTAVEKETLKIGREGRGSSYHPPGSATADSWASLTLGSSRPLSDILPCVAFPAYGNAQDFESGSLCVSFRDRRRRR